jgi:hypothetical protein
MSKAANSAVLIWVLASTATPNATHAAGLVNWIGGDGDWEDGTQWSGGLVPGGTDDVTIAGLVDVTASAPGNAALTLMNEAGFELAGGDLDVIGLFSNAGTTSVTGGKFEANFIANDISGDIRVSGANSELSVVVEFNNAGTLTIEQLAHGATANLTNLNLFTLQSAATVDAETLVNDGGATSVVQNALTTLTVADNITNAGDFSVIDHAVVIAESFANYAGLMLDDGTVSADSFLNAALGVIDLTGAATGFAIGGNVTNQGEFTVRSGAHGDVVSIGNENKLVVSGGGLLESISILNDPAASIVVTGLGSRLALTDNLQSSGSVEVDDAAALDALSIGTSGDLTVRNGARIGTESILNMSGGKILVEHTGSEVVLGNNFENAGTVEVRDNASVTAGSYVNESDTTLSSTASLSTTTLVNQAGAVLSVTGTNTTIDVTGVLETNGTLAITSGARVTAGVFEQGAGTTSLDGGTLGSSDTGIVILGGLLEGSGALEGSLYVFPGGTAAPGTSADMTTNWNVSGLAQLGGTLLIDIEGLAGGAFDTITASGAVSLGGVLDVKLLGGFEPLIGDTFDIVLGTSVAGAFATEILPVFDGRTFDVVLGLDFVRLTVTAAPIPIPAAAYLMLPALALLRARRKLRN